MSFASVSINGVAGPLFDGELNSAIETFNGVDFTNNQVAMQSIAASGVGPFIGVTGENPLGIIPVSIDTPQTITFDPTYRVVRGVAWGQSNATTALFVSVSTLVYSTGGGGDVGGVPEPSTRTMLLLGFAGLGCVAWRASLKAEAVA
jgi:hypothetical protein